VRHAAPLFRQGKDTGSSLPSFPHPRHRDEPVLSGVLSKGTAPEQSRQYERHKLRSPQADSK